MKPFSRAAARALAVVFPLGLVVSTILAQFGTLGDGALAVPASSAIAAAGAGA